MKRVLSIVIALVLVLSVFSFASAEEVKDPSPRRRA